MIRSLYFTPDQPLRTDLPTNTYREVTNQAGGVLWVDFEGTPPETDEPLLREVFGFHPLAVDDALQESHVPKLDDWDSFLYIVLHAITFIQDTDEKVSTLELDIFLGPNYLVTHHDQVIPALSQLWSSCQRDERILRRGVPYLLYRLTDEVVASYMPVVEALDDEIDRLEDEIFDAPTPRTLERIFDLKRAILQVRRISGPQREVLNKLARDQYHVLPAETRVYYRDVYDHLVRLHDIAESLRDLVSGTMDTYLSVINNRMNDIMKTLTVITVLFMPLSFIAGFFGMNFFAADPPLTGWVTEPVFIIMLVFMFLAPLGLYLWIRRRGWM